MDTILAAVIGPLVPILAVAARRWWLRWRRWRLVQEKRRDHERVIAESLLAVTLRLAELERELADLRRRVWPE